MSFNQRKWSKNRSKTPLPHLLLLLLLLHPINLPRVAHPRPRTKGLTLPSLMRAHYRTHKVNLKNKRARSDRVERKESELIECL